MYTKDLHYSGASVSSAISELEQSIKLARNSKERVLCLIVGYGSSGGSHKIKTAILEALTEKKNKNQIKEFIIGSNIDLFNVEYLNMKFRNLIPDDVKRRRNPGEIIVIL